MKWIFSTSSERYISIKNTQRERYQHNKNLLRYSIPAYKVKENDIKITKTSNSPNLIPPKRWTWQKPTSQRLAGRPSNPSLDWTSNNGPFARWRLFTTKTRIHFIFPFIFKFGSPGEVLLTKALICTRKQYPEGFWSW